jgi:hypothetical protein
MHRRVVSLLVSLVVAGWVAWGGAAAPSANVAQVDFTGSFNCHQDQDILAASLGTSGQPVQVTLVLAIEETSTTGPEATIDITPVLDGAPQTGDLVRVTVWPGIDRQGWDTKTVTRLYPVAAGAHTVSWLLHCASPSTTSLLRAWALVYELPRGLP